jgi:hypothetical protein
LHRRTITFSRANSPIAPKGEPPVYNADQLEEIGAAYEAEERQRRGDIPRLWPQTHVDDDISPLVKGPISLTSSVSWVAAWSTLQLPTDRLLWKWLQEEPGAKITNPDTGLPDSLLGFHWDPGVARVVGQPHPFLLGPQRISWISHMITDWAGYSGRLLGLEVKLLRPDYIGDTVWLRGKITSKAAMSDTEGQVECSITASNQRGEQCMAATATVALPVG